MEIGCSIADALVGGWCVGELGWVRMYVFAEWSGCSVVLCVVLVLRCAGVVVYVMGVRCAVVLHRWVWSDCGPNRGDVCGT